MNFDFALFCFFNLRWVCSFPMHGLPLCLWVVLENSSLIACPVITLSKNLGFSSICFEMSAQISWRFFFLIASKKLWNNLCTDLCHMQIFVQYLPHCFFVNGHPLCYQSNTKPTIFSDNFFTFPVIVRVFDMVGHRERSSSPTSVGPIGVARGGPGGPPPPIKIPLTRKSYDNIAWRCLVAVFFSVIMHITVINNNINDNKWVPGPPTNNQGALTNN